MQDTNPRPVTIGTMPIGATGYVPAAALTVDQRHTCHLRTNARTQPRPDTAHALFVVRTKRGFIVDITALDGAPGATAAGDTGRCAPVIEVVFGDEVILAA